MNYEIKSLKKKLEEMEDDESDSIKQSVYSIQIEMALSELKIPDSYIEKWFETHFECDC